MRIQRLPDLVANQIAAGEVVERPASVIKELVENSLDAGATRIHVQVAEGGRVLRITDNGCGMTKEEAPFAFERFTTSKIRNADDLWKLTTMGFRGEALASIASVARIECRTRPASQDLGTRVMVEGGEITACEAIGCAAGTSFQINDLFYNVPARLKFLKSPTTEVGYIQELVQAIALANPEIGFQFSHGERENLRTLGDGDVLSTARQVWGRDIADHLFTFEGETPMGKLKGVATWPTYVRADRSRQMIFINRRWVRIPMLTKVVDELWSDLVPDRRHPAFILAIELDPSLVDVNVHPTKREVRLKEAQALRDLAYRTLSKALKTNTTVHEPAAAGDWSRAFGDVPATGQTVPALRQIPKAIPNPAPAQVLAAIDFYQPVIPKDALPEPVQPDRTFGEQILELHPIGQAFDTYILAEGPQGLYLIDQHVAHERVLYDRLKREKVASQTLMIAPLVKLSPFEVSVAQDNREMLESHGFHWQDAEGGVQLTAIPQILHLDSAVEAFQEFVSDAVVHGSVSERSEPLAALHKMMVCRASIKAGDRLAPEQIRAVIQQLAETPQPFTCPHGRPIVTILSPTELHRRFGRI